MPMWTPVGSGSLGEFSPGSGNGPVFSTLMSLSSVRSSSIRSIEVIGVFLVTPTRFERGSFAVSVPSSAYFENLFAAYGSTPELGDQTNALLYTFMPADPSPASLGTPGPPESTASYTVVRSPLT